MAGNAQLALVAGKGFNGWLIRTVQTLAGEPPEAAKFTHILLAESPDVVISCEPTGVKRMPVSAFPDAVWSHFKLTQWQQDQITEYAGDQVGKPYDRLGYIWAGIAILLKMKPDQSPPHFIERRLAQHKSWICSQLCDAAYSRARIHFFKGRLNGAIVPASFAPIWEANGWL
jgi:hypothetical protein